MHSTFTHTLITNVNRPILGKLGASSKAKHCQALQRNEDPLERKPVQELQDGFTHTAPNQKQRRCPSTTKRSSSTKCPALIHLQIIGGKIQSWQLRPSTHVMNTNTHDKSRLNHRLVHLNNKSHTNSITKNFKKK